MKKIIVISFLCLAPLLSFGGSTKFICGLSSVTNNILEGTSNSKAGFFGGFGIEPGVGKLRLENTYVYSFRTHKFEFNGKSYWHRFHVITSDLALKYKFMVDSSPYLFIGGYLSYILSQKKNSSGKILDVPIDDFFDYGIVLGAGLEFFFRSFSIMFEGRYRRGMAYLDIENFTFKTGELAICLGIRFFSYRK